jgi:hypothetical protein
MASNMMPNFLIVGAAKCGTTSLYRYLSQHPDIVMPKWKELSLFIGDPHGPLHRVRKPQYYERVFAKTKGRSAIGEASTSYLYDEHAPKRIKEALGAVKIIIILRYPVEMSYSLYNHQVRREGETIKTFEAALEAEDSRRKDSKFRRKCYGWHANYYYYHRGLYFEQVKRYLDTFGKNSVMIVLFQDLVDDPAGACQRTFRFLGVDDSFVPEIKVHNPAGQVLHIPRFWRDAGLFQKTVSFVFSWNLIRKIPHLLRNVRRKTLRPINPTTADRLRERFHDDVCRLERLIGQDLSTWKRKERPDKSRC